MNNFGTTIRTTTSTRTRKTSQLRNLELIKIRVGENHLLWSSTRRTCSAKLNAQKVTMNTAKDLKKEPPRSLCERIGGYAERSDLPVMQNESTYGAGNTTKSLVGSAGRPLINSKGDIFANFKTFSKEIAFHKRT